jgi:hypothetical protein
MKRGTIVGSRVRRVLLISMGRLDLLRLSGVLHSLN